MQTNDIAAPRWSSSAGLIAIAMCCGLLGSCGQESAPPDTGQERLILYTSLAEDRAIAIVRAYPEATGVVINHLLESDDVLIEKMVTKEHYPGADLLLISGAGALARAVDSDVLRPIRSEALDRDLAAHYRDPDGYWFAVGARAEMIVVDRRVVDAAAVTGYAALGDPLWAGRLCLQRGTVARNRSLVAAMIAALGERDAELAVRGWRGNLATSVFDEQRDLLAAIEDGDCAIGIAGSDAVARFVADGSGENLGFVFPDSGAGGTQLDLTAVGVSRHANDPDGATRFIEWLVSPAGQQVLRDTDFDFAVDDVTSPQSPLDGWPDFDVSPMGVSRTGYLHPEATRLIERARYR